LGPASASASSACAFTFFSRPKSYASSHVSSRRLYGFAFFASVASSASARFLTLGDAPLSSHRSTFKPNWLLAMLTPPAPFSHSLALTARAALALSPPTAASSRALTAAAAARVVRSAGSSALASFSPPLAAAAAAAC
jgi:hypothetical protein